RRSTRGPRARPPPQGSQRARARPPEARATLLGDSPHMHEQQQPESARAANNPRRSAVPPSSSRMIASYLTDIEQMLDEHRWDAALKEASDLPRIAVALADPGLRSPGDQVKTWCQQWVKLPGTKRAATGGEDHERLARGVSDRAVPTAEREPVPTRALRRLQL